MPRNPAKEQHPFFQYGCSDTDVDYEFEDALVGNKEGFEILRAKIAELLEQGDQIALNDDHVRTDFTFLKLAKLSSDAEVPAPNERLFKFGCIAVCLLGTAVFISGLVKIYEWLT